MHTLLICDKPVYENVAVKIDVVFLVYIEKRKRDSDDSDESQPGPSTPKKTSRPRGFCDDWPVKYDLLYLENGKMKCHPCVNTHFQQVRVALWGSFSILEDQYVTLSN